MEWLVKARRARSKAMVLRETLLWADFVSCVIAANFHASFFHSLWAWRGRIRTIGKGGMARESEVYHEGMSRTQELTEQESVEWTKKFILAKKLLWAWKCILTLATVFAEIVNCKPFALKKDWQTINVKGQRANSVSLGDYAVSRATTQLCPYSSKFVNNWMELCSNKTLFMGMEIKLYVHFMCHKIVFKNCFFYCLKMFWETILSLKPYKNRLWAWFGPWAMVYWPLL